MPDVTLGIDATQLPPRVAWALANGQNSPSIVSLGRAESPQPACQSVPCSPPVEDLVDGLVTENFVRTFDDWSESHPGWFSRHPEWNIVRIGIAHPALLPERAISELSQRVARSALGRKAADNIPRSLLAAPLAIAIQELRQRESLVSDAGTLLTCSPGLGFTGKNGVAWWSREWLLLNYERDAGQLGYRLRPQWFCSHVPELGTRNSIEESEWARRRASLSPGVSIVSAFDVARESVNSSANGSSPRGQHHPDSVALGAAAYAQISPSEGQENGGWKMMHPIPLPRGILGVSDSEPPLHVWREIPTTSTVDAAEPVRVPLSHVSIVALHGVAEIDPLVPRWRVVEPSVPSADCPWIFHGVQRGDGSRGISQDWHIVRLDRQPPSWSSQNISVKYQVGSVAPLVENVRQG